MYINLNIMVKSSLEILFGSFKEISRIENRKYILKHSNLFHVFLDNKIFPNIQCSFKIIPLEE